MNAELDKLSYQHGPAADALGISPATLARWRDEGIVRSVVVKGIRLYPKRELEGILITEDSPNGIIKQENNRIMDHSISVNPKGRGVVKFLSLFTGIGGLDLGLERAGMTCVAQVEIDPFCRRVLEKHWPKVLRFEDVKTVTREMLPDGIEVIAGGFPCQDISNVGKKAGIDGSRSGLWREFLRLICDLRPAYVLVENVAALLERGMGRVLSDLAESGYDAEWDCIPVAAFGAPHCRYRVFILAYPASQRRAIHFSGRSGIFRGVPLEEFSSQGEGRICKGWWKRWEAHRLDNGRVRMVPPGGIQRATDGIPARVDRLKSVGNSVSPVVGEWMGLCLMQYAGRVV